MSWYQYLLNELGVAIVDPNVRGSTGYGRRFTSLDTGRKREDSVKDIGPLIAWIGAGVKKSMKFLENSVGEGAHARFVHQLLCRGVETDLLSRSRCGVFTLEYVFNGQLDVCAASLFSNIVPPEKSTTSSSAIPDELLVKQEPRTLDSLLPCSLDPTRIGVWGDARRVEGL